MVRDVSVETPHNAGREHLVPTAILASGSGTNLEAVVSAARQGLLPLDVRLVVSNKPRAFALTRAARAGITTAVLEFDKRTEDRAEYARRLASLIQSHGAQLVLLLGWMHVLAPGFLSAGFEGVLNLHPAYLPLDPAADTVSLPDGTQSPVFRGAHALRDALEAKVPFTGASLIQITSRADRGPVLARKALRLFGNENEESALERLHEVEREVVREGILSWIKQRQPA